MQRVNAKVQRRNNANRKRARLAPLPILCPGSFAPSRPGVLASIPWNRAFPSPVIRLCLCGSARISICLNRFISVFIDLFRFLAKGLDKTMQQFNDVTIPPSGQLKPLKNRRLSVSFRIFPRLSAYFENFFTKFWRAVGNPQLETEKFTPIFSELKLEPRRKAQNFSLKSYILLLPCRWPEGGLKWLVVNPDGALACTI
jgi:hypothetical protein